MKIGAVLLCSGLSRRMENKNKLLIKIDNKPMFQYNVDNVIRCDFDEIVAVTAYDEIEKYCLRKGIKTIRNSNSQLGQAQSIKLGTKALYDMDAIAYFVCDQPFLSCNSIMKLKNNIQENGITVPVCEGNSYSPCIFSKKYFDLLLTLEGDKGGKSIIKNNTDYVNYVYFTDKKEFFDIDNLDDLISL